MSTLSEINLAVEHIYLTVMSVLGGYLKGEQPQFDSHEYWLLVYAYRKKLKPFEAEGQKLIELIREFEGTSEEFVLALSEPAEDGQHPNGPGIYQLVFIVRYLSKHPFSFCGNKLLSRLFAALLDKLEICRSVPLCFERIIASLQFAPRHRGSQVHRDFHPLTEFLNLLNQDGDDVSDMNHAPVATLFFECAENNREQMGLLISLIDPSILSDLGFNTWRRVISYYSSSSLVSLWEFLASNKKHIEHNRFFWQALAEELLKHNDRLVLLDYSVFIDVIAGREFSLADALTALAVQIKPHSEAASFLETHTKDGTLLGELFNKYHELFLGNLIINAVFSTGPLKKIQDAIKHHKLRHHVEMAEGADASAASAASAAAQPITTDYQQTEEMKKAIYLPVQALRSLVYPLKPTTYITSLTPAIVELKRHIATFSGRPLALAQGLCGKVEEDGTFQMPAITYFCDLIFLYSASAVPLNSESLDNLYDCFNMIVDICQSEADAMTLLVYGMTSLNLKKIATALIETAIQDPVPDAWERLILSWQMLVRASLSDKRRMRSILYLDCWPPHNTPSEKYWREHPLKFLENTRLKSARHMRLARSIFSPLVAGLYKYRVDPDLLTDECLAFYRDECQDFVLTLLFEHLDTHCTPQEAEDCLTTILESEYPNLFSKIFADDNRWLGWSRGELPTVTKIRDKISEVKKQRNRSNLDGGAGPATMPNDTVSVAAAPARRVHSRPPHQVINSSP